MDIAAGLTLLGQATNIVKGLREIDKGFDLAALKARMADLYGTLADVKIALSDARETIHDRDGDADELKGMGRYVHLCFRSNHPMEYLARQDGRIGDSIFLEIHPSVMQFAGVMFTPDVSNKAGVEAVPITQAAGLIDFEVLYTRTEWSDQAIQHRLKQAEKCEVLVPCHIPLTHIRNI